MPLVNHGCHLLCGQPRAGRGEQRDESDPDPALETLPGLGGETDTSSKRQVKVSTYRQEHLKDCQMKQVAGLRVWYECMEKNSQKNQQNAEYKVIFFKAV